MKRIFLIICVLVGFFVIVPKVVANEGDVIKPVAMKHTYKSLFQVKTFTADGSKIGESTGFFISSDGKGVAPYSLFKGASRAEVIDYKGKVYHVSRILGASEHYDLVKFTTMSGKKIQPLPLITEGELHVGQNVYLAKYTTNKKQLPIPVKVDVADDFDNYKYYTIAAANDSSNIFAPVLTENGYVVAFSQYNIANDSLGLCAIDIRFINDLTIDAASAFNSDLTAIKIPKSLPQSEADAQTFVYMASRMDSTTAHTALNDFLVSYPDNAEGYMHRAAFFVRCNNFAGAELDYSTALDKSANPASNLKTDEVYNTFSKLIYNKAVNQPNQLPENWNLQRALEEAQKAYQVRPLRYYLMQQGHCLFAQKKYAEAYEKYIEVCTNTSADTTTWSQQSQKETWFYATRAYELSGGDSVKVVELMDSVIAHLPRPVEVSDAVYFLERALRLEQIGQYRKAVLDYNEYENVVGNGNLNAHFYYLREQLEMKCGMYQQALDDINTAMSRNPQHPDYPVEHALILLRAGLYNEAIDVCSKKILTITDNPDYYKILGISFGELGKYKQALDNLYKAESLGDPTVSNFIEKYSKASSSFKK